jgi:hypothetical protein
VSVVLSWLIWQGKKLFLGEGRDKTWKQATLAPRFVTSCSSATDSLDVVSYEQTKRTLVLCVVNLAVCFRAVMPGLGSDTTRPQLFTCIGLMSNIHCRQSKGLKRVSQADYW